MLRMSTPTATGPDFCPLLQHGPPEWASGFGQDAFGYFIEIELPLHTHPRKTAGQRLRWIPAGEFWMGSPESEAGRYDDEDRHPVQISSGYWLFDSACPQWLWESVMSSNPSNFVDPDRPVERVSWDACVTFLTRLNARLGSGANFRLPTEAEWEYACRAGTKTALYTGDLTLVGENNGPELDEIAWYGGNSGVGYELDKSYDGSGWPAKQYEFSRCGSRRVKSRRCNAWGLYDMLGNVWEWCSDWYGAYDLSRLSDPPGAPFGFGSRRSRRQLVQLRPLRPGGRPLQGRSGFV
ncbi:MAG UNVERIFIED_CONTAM: formylglycine-generating enzyme family protein [Planctomycetaceae bacterium]